MSHSEHVGVINQSSLLSLTGLTDIYYALAHYNELANFSIKKENAFNWVRQTERGGETDRTPR